MAQVFDTEQETSNIPTVDVQVPEQAPLQDPPSKKLWEALSSKEYGQLYTKSYDDFKKQFSTPESISKLHATLSSPDYEFYTKSLDDFNNQFFSDVKKKEEPTQEIPIVDISEPNSTGSKGGVSNVTTPTPTETPAQQPIDISGRITFDQKEPYQPKVAAPGEPAPANAIDLVLQANNNLNKKIGKVKDQTGREREIDQPDLQAQNEGKKTLDYLKTFKIDTDDLYNKIKDLPPEIYNTTSAKKDGTIDYPYSKEKLFEMYQNEPAKFNFTINQLKNMADITKGAEGATIDGQPVDKSYFGKLYNNLNVGANLQDWEQKKGQQIELINKYLPSLDARRVALDRLESNASMYYTPANPDVMAEYNASPLKDKLDPAQFSALQMQKMFHPDKYKQAVEFLSIEPKTEYTGTTGMTFGKEGFKVGTPETTETQESINRKIGKETFLKNLSDEGRYNSIMNLQYKNEKIASQLKAFPADQNSQLVEKYNASAEELKKLSSQNEELKNQIDQNLGKYKDQYIQQYNYNIQRANSINQEMNGIAEQFKQMPQDNRGQLIAQYNDNLAKINAIKADYKKDAERYPNYFDLKYEQQVKDFMQQAGFNAAEYGAYKFGMGLIKSGKTLENVGISLFGSNEDKILHNLASYGESQVDASNEYLPSKYQSGNNLVTIKVGDDLKNKLNSIIKGRDLSDLNASEKEKMKLVLADNQDQVHTITDTTKEGKGANFLSLATLYANTGMLGDIMSFGVQAGTLGAFGIEGAMASAIPMWTTTQDDSRKEGIAKGLTGSELDGYANLNATIMFLAGVVTPQFDVLKRIAGTQTATGKLLSGITEDTWNSVINKNRPIIDRIKNSLVHTTGEALHMAGTYGVAAPALQQVVGKEMYGDRLSYADIKNNVMESAEHLLKSSAALLTVGTITNFKAVSPEQKAALWQLGANPKMRLTEIDDALKNGEINTTQAEARKKVIQDASNIIQTMPTKNMQGKPLTDKERIDYFYNLLIQDKAKTEKKSLPIPQVKKIEYAEMVADHLNNLIVDPQDETQLNDRIKELNKILKTDENDIDAQAELDAINIHLENLAQEKQPTKTPEEILTGKPATPTEIGGFKVIAEDEPIGGERVFKVVDNNGVERFLTADGKELRVAKATAEVPAETTTTEVTAPTLEDIRNEFGDVAYRIAKLQTEKLGEEYVNLERVRNTANRIIELGEKDKGTAVAEALQYEMGYPDNWTDLRNAIEKGGIEMNADAVKRMIDAGVELPKDILDKYSEFSKEKEVTPKETEVTSQVTAPTLEEGAIVELPPQVKGALPRKMIYKDGIWQEQVGSQVTGVSEKIQKQAQTEWETKNPATEKITEAEQTKKSETIPAEVDAQEQARQKGEPVIGDIYTYPKGKEEFELISINKNGNVTIKNIKTGEEINITDSIFEDLKNKKTGKAKWELEEEPSYEPDAQELARQDWQDELDNSGYSYGQYGGRKSDTYYITDNKTKKVVKEIKFTNPTEGSNEVYKWIDQQAGTKIFEKREKLREIAEANKKEKVTTEKPTTEEVTPPTTPEKEIIKEPSELEKAKAARLAAKEKLNQIRGRLGAIRDTKAEAQALYDYHVATIKLAKEHIKEGIKTLEDFAKSIGEKVSDQLKTAWNEAQKNIQTIKSASETLKYNTGEKEGISYLSESSDVDYPSGGGVQGEGGKVSQSIVGVWGKDKNIQFTGTTRVKNAADVAHIMQLLENKTVEHAFAVHIDKNGKSHIQFLSIGGVSGTVVDPKAVLAGVKKFKSVRTFLIHNHPSGNMQPSNADLQITEKIRAGLDPLGVKLEHIIMDTFSKEYIHIDEYNIHKVYKRDETIQDKVKLSTHTMNDMMILSNPIVRVRQAADAVNFLQQLRFTAMPKNAMLLLDYGNSIIGNYVFKGEIDYDQITSFIAESGTGSNVIFYGNNFDKALILAMKDHLSKLDVKVLDHIVTSSDTNSVNQYYESMMEAGHLSETQIKYGTNIVNEVGADQGENEQTKKEKTIASVEATAKALEEEKINISEFPILPKSKLSEKEIKNNISKIKSYNDIVKLLKKAYGDKIPIYHAATKESSDYIDKNGLKPTAVKNAKYFGTTEGYYVQIGKSDYYGSNRPKLYYAEVPIDFLTRYSRIDTDGLMNESDLSDAVGFDVEDLSSDTRDFINAIVTNNYKLDGIEFLIDKELSDNNINKISLKVKEVTPQTISEEYHKGNNPELIKVVNEALGVSELPKQKGVGKNVEVTAENINKLDEKKKNELAEKANIFYHGTVANFKEFIANKIKSGAIQIKGALFFTNKKARAEAFGLQSYKNVSSELFNLSRNTINLNQYESYKNSTRELPKDLMNNVNNYFKSIGIEDSVKTIGDLAKSYEKYRNEKEAKYNVKAIKIKEGAKIKVIEGKKNWKETLSKLNEESGKLKNEYKDYDVLIFKNIEDYPLMQKPSEEITNADNIVVLNPSKIETIENESDAISNSYNEVLRIPKEQRTEQQNQLISSVNEALGKAELPKQENLGEKVEVPSVEKFTKKIEPTSSTIKTVAGDKAYNYVNKDGVEVTLKEDEEGGYVNGNQVQADVHLDFIGNDTKRGEGLASKELDRIIKEADNNNMSISLIVDSDQAVRGTKSEKGLGNKELKKWYESKGFIFDKDSRFGYRPKATEDVSIYKKPEYIASKGEVTNDNLEYHSSPEDLQEAFDQDRLKEGTFHEDGTGDIYKLESGKLKEVKNVKYEPYENNKFVDKIIYSELPKQEQKGVEPITALQKAQETRRAAKAKLDEIKGRLGIAKDIEAQAQALFDYHKALVAEAKEYVKLGIKKVEDFAKEIGEKVDDAVKAAWNEAMGIIPPAKVPEDLKHIARVLETGMTDEEWTGISQSRMKEIESVRKIYEREKGTTWTQIQQDALEQLARKYPNKTIYEAARLEVEMLADKYDNKEDYNPTAKDLAVIQEFKRQTEKKINDLQEDLNSDIDLQRNLAAIQIEAYEDDLAKVGKALFKREAGTAFGFRASESMMDENYGLQIRRAKLIRANDGEPLSEADNKFLEDQWTKEKELMKKEQQIREQGLKDAFDAQLEKVKKDYEEKMKSMKPKTTPEVRKQALSKTGKDVADVIRRLKLRGTKLDFTIGGWNLAVEGVARIVEAGFTVAEAIEQLIQNKTIGFKTAEDRKIFEDNLASFINNLDRRETSLEDIKKMAQANGDTTITIDMVKKGLIKDFINSHVGEFENKDILEEAYKELKKVLPDLDRNTLRRAMLRLDEFKTPDKKTMENMLAQETRALKRLLEKEESQKVKGNEKQKRLLEKEKKSIQRKIREFQRKLKEGEFEKEEPVTLKKQDAELIQLNKEKKEAEGAFRQKQKELEEKNKHWAQNIADTLRSSYVAFLIGSPVTLAKVAYMSIIRPTSEIARKALLGKLFNLFAPNISKAAEKGGESSRLRPLVEGLKAYFRQNTAASIEKKSQLAIKKYDQSAKAYYDALNTGADAKTLKRLEKQMNRDLTNSLSNIIYQFIGGSSIKDSWQSFVNRSNEIEKQFGKVDIEKFNKKEFLESGGTSFAGMNLNNLNYLLGFIGRSHSAAKTFSGRFSFAVSFMTRLEAAIKDGSISDPNRVIEIAHESYLDWERGKYQQENWVTNKWNDIVATIRKNTSKNPEWKKYDKSLEALTKTEVAITRVPVNVLHEQIAEYLLGAFRAPWLAYKERAKAKQIAKDELINGMLNSADFKKRIKEIVSNMDQDQAAKIFRLFTKGGLGLGLYGLTLVTGLMHFGVFPHKGQKKKKEEYELEPEELNPGQVMFGDDKLGENASKLIEHSPALWPSFMGLGLAKIYADDVKSGKMTAQAAWDAVYTHLEIVEGGVPQTKIFSPLTAIKDISKSFAGKASSYGIFDKYIDAKGHFIDQEKEGLKLTSPEVLRLKKYNVAPPELGTRKMYKIQIDKTHPRAGMTPEGKEYALMNPNEFTKFTEYRKSYIDEVLRALYRAEDGAFIGTDKDFRPDYVYIKPNKTIYNLMQQLANKPENEGTIELNKQVFAEILPMIISESTIVAKNKLIEDGLLPESNYEDEEGNDNMITIKEIIQDLYENNMP